MMIYFLVCRGKGKFVEGLVVCLTTILKDANVVRSCIVYGCQQNSTPVVQVCRICKTWPAGGINR